MAALALLAAGIVATGGRTSAARVPPAPRVTPGGEVRAVWVVRDDLTSPAAIHQIVENVRAAGLNTIFLQVRGRGDAWYQSSLEPRAEGLAGAPADFDPLATGNDDLVISAVSLRV